MQRREEVRRRGEARQQGEVPVREVLLQAEEAVVLHAPQGVEQGEQRWRALEVEQGGQRRRALEAELHARQEAARAEQHELQEEGAVQHARQGAERAVQHEQQVEAGAVHREQQAEAGEGHRALAEAVREVQQQPALAAGDQAVQHRASQAADQAVPLSSTAAQAADRHCQS